MAKCNLCGKELDEFDIQQQAEIHIHLQYGSAYDGDYLNLQMCNKCMDMLIGQCAISPVTEGEIDIG